MNIQKIIFSLSNYYACWRGNLMTYRVAEADMPLERAVALEAELERVHREHRNLLFDYLKELEQEKVNLRIENERQRDEISKLRDVINGYQLQDERL